MKPEYAEHEGHRIEVRPGAREPELLIDDVPVRYGRLPNGKYFLDDYAFDWSDDLLEVARRYVSYRARVEKVKASKRNRKEE